VQPLTLNALLQVIDPAVLSSALEVFFVDGEVRAYVVLAGDVLVREALTGSVQACNLM
jgi:hypothetical protein